MNRHLHRLDSLLTPERVRHYPLVLLLLTLGMYALSAARAHHWIEPGGRVIGRDYLAFFMAGEMVREDALAQLYDFPAQQAFQQAFMADINPDWSGTCLYLNPPHYAWLMSLITPLGYGGSLVAWWLLSIACFVGTAAIWRKWLPAADFGSAVVLAVCMPAWFWALAGGQNSFFSLVILTGFCALMIARHEFGAGLVLSALAFKFQLLLLPAGVLLLKRRWRAIAGLAAGGAATLLATAVLLGPHSITAYVEFTAGLGRLLQIDGFDVHKQHSWHGFFALLGKGTLPPATIKALAATMSLASLVPLFVVWRGNRSPADLPMQLTALMVANLLICPHLFHYDMLLVTLPAVLWLVALRRGATCPPATVLRSLLALGFCWLAVSPGLAGWLDVQLSPLIMLVWLIVAARATRAYAHVLPASPTPASGESHDRPQAATELVPQGPDRHGPRPGPARHAL